MTANEIGKMREASNLANEWRWTSNIVGKERLHACISRQRFINQCIVVPVRLFFRGGIPGGVELDDSARAPTKSRKWHDVHHLAGTRF